MKHRFGKRSMDVVSVVTDIGVQFTFPVAKSLQGTFGDCGGHCLSIALCEHFLHRSRFADKRSSSDKALITHGGCSVNTTVAHHVLSQSLFVELNIINLFGGCCGVISASAGDSTDSTCSATVFRCVVPASSSPMSQLASLTSMTLSHIRREPRRSPTRSGQISKTLF